MGISAHRVSRRGRAECAGNSPMNPFAWTTGMDLGPYLCRGLCHRQGVRDVAERPGGLRGQEAWRKAVRTRGKTEKLPLGEGARHRQSPVSVDASVARV